METLLVLFPVVTCSSLRLSIDTDASAFITESTVNETFSLARDRYFSCVHCYRTSRSREGEKELLKQ